jgi:glycosyltransferase involved in cell wall biosynthesis
MLLVNNKKVKIYKENSFSCDVKKTEISVAIFAHNISGEISYCIKSILSSLPDNYFTLYVLANGCTDSTESIVRSFQLENKNIYLVSIPLADKANAWNYYVHELAPVGTLHFFIDGDIKVEPGALSCIAKTMKENPVINVVGGVPVVGRDREGWIQRMISFGRISGGLYAIRESFLLGLRKNKVKLPIGFIGEDFLISALAKDMESLQELYSPNHLLKIETQAGFSFRQLSLLRIGDYLSYFRRLVRYRMRDYQLSMLMTHVETYSIRAMPISVGQMYSEEQLLPRYYWRGRNTAVDFLAVLTIRTIAKKFRGEK